VATIPAENLERFIVVKPLFQSRGVTDHAWQPFKDSLAAPIGSQGEV
jgi:hypothetical protein